MLRTHIVLKDEEGGWIVTYCGRRGFKRTAEVWGPWEYAHESKQTRFQAVPANVLGDTTPAADCLRCCDQAGRRVPAWRTAAQPCTTPRPEGVRHVDHRTC